MPQQLIQDLFSLGGLCLQRRHTLLPGLGLALPLFPPLSLQRLLQGCCLVPRLRHCPGGADGLGRQQQGQHRRCKSRSVRVSRMRAKHDSGRAAHNSEGKKKTNKAKRPKRQAQTFINNAI